MLCVPTAKPSAAAAQPLAAVAVAAASEPFAAAAISVAAAAPVRGSRSMYLPVRPKHRGLVPSGLAAHCKLLPWPCC